VKKQFPVNQRKSSAGRGRQGKADQGVLLANPGGTIWKRTLGSLFGLDPRSLALFRMAMGALLLADLAIRATDLKAMYTDEGMFSRGEICFHYTTIWNWSFHFGSGSWTYQAMLFGIAAALALALVAGFETRLATIGSWLMLVSLQHRVPPIGSGADALLRMLLFWAMFLPLNRAWSLDGWLDKRRGSTTMRGDPAPVLSVASGAILLQMALVYLFTAIFKSNLVWLRGEAVAGVLAHDFYASPLGAYLLQFPRVLTGLTRCTFFLEWVAPLLLFFPKYTAWLRLGVIAALAAMHVGIGLCLEVDLFSPVSLAGLSLFLPAEFWDGLRARFWRTSRSAKPIASAGKSGAKQRPPLLYVTQGACLLLLIYVMVINFNGLPSHPLAQLEPEKKDFLWTGCGLGQKWIMFDEIPSKNGWYVAAAKLNDGSDVDLLRHGAAVDWSKPHFPAGLYPNHRWRKCFREMAYADELGYQVFRVPVARFLCRDWNARNTAEKQIAEFDLIYCNERDARIDMSTVQSNLREQLVHLDFNSSEGERAAASDL